MATKMGAAGVRIELKDNSAYSVITTPRATAGIVGFAPKGELNKIQLLTNTSEQTTYFGLGYNNYRYNQGLYAARAVLDAGGFVEYIRPYGEEIDTSDAFKRDLKTDAFVVTFDRDPMNVTKKDASGNPTGKQNTAGTSLQVEYFASTRYKTDGAANYGVTRKINNIAEAVVKNNNVDFNVDAADDYSERSSRSRGDTDMVLFAILNKDPSAANRAYTSYAVTFRDDNGDNDPNTFRVDCTTLPAFGIGDVLYAPVATGDAASKLYAYTVTNVVDRTVSLVATDTVPSGYKPTVLYFCDRENAIADNSDYLTVKTAVTGRGSKLFSALSLTDGGVNALKSLGDGVSISVRDAMQNPNQVRFHTTNEPVAATVDVPDDDGICSIEVTGALSVVPGDTLEATYTMMPTDGETQETPKKTGTIDLVVTAVGETSISATLDPAEFPTVPEGYEDPTWVIKISKPVSDWIDVTGIEASAALLPAIADKLHGEPFGYGSRPVIADIETLEKGSMSVKVTQGSVYYFAAGNKVAILSGGNVTTGTVASVDGYTSTVTLREAVQIEPVEGAEYVLLNLSTTNRTAFATSDGIYVVGSYDMTVPMTSQTETSPVDVEQCTSVFNVAYADGYHIVESSERVLLDSDIGVTFVQLGLASIQYMDVNYTGKVAKVFDLTDEGEAIARLYMSVAYKFAGKLYEFEGTVVPYVYNNMQLSIVDTATAELIGSGAVFMPNDSGILDMFLEDSSYDLSGTLVGGKPNGSMTQIAFNEKDPAIVHNAVWTYNPQNNIGTSTIASAYSLFLDKDNSDVAFIVGAGMGVNNFGLRSYESLNTTVIQAVLNICELRKDCFSLFDGVNETDIEKALAKDMLAARFPAQLGRWGAIYDARPVFYDSIVTLRNVEVAPSVAMASLIMANRADTVFWRPPAGKTNGIVPSAWCTTVRNKRKFSYPEDPNSDIARLSDIHVNPFRTTNDGIYAWMDYTMQMEDTAFNQIHVAMLMAGIHKMFYHYLDGMVFLINDPGLRSTIQSSIQARLDAITYGKPSGFKRAYCICDETNNPPEVVDQNKLYVDIKVEPRKSNRIITLRSEVLSSKTGNTVTMTME